MGGGSRANAGAMNGKQHRAVQRHFFIFSLKAWRARGVRSSDAMVVLSAGT
jgi:hypothetical protein